MQPVIDATAFIGDYPFRGFPRSTFGDLQTLMRQYGIARAVVSSFHELFWENNFDASLRCADEIRAEDSLSHFIAVNPIYPRQLQELESVLEQTGAAGLRLFPNYHGYHLWDAPVRDVLEIAAARDVPVQIFRMIQDERMHWLLSVLPVPYEEFEWLLAAPPEAKVLLSGLAFADIVRLGAKLKEAPNIKVDLSRVRGPVFGVEKLVESVGAEKLVFGSLWPIQMIAPTLRQIEDAKINDDARAAILGANWMRTSAELTADERR